MKHDQVHGVLRMAAPTTPEKSDTYEERKRHDLFTILDSDREENAPPRLRSWPKRKLAHAVLVAAGVVAVSALAVGQLGSGGTSVYAATPPVLATPTAAKGSASSDLRALASRVNTLPTSTPPAVPYTAISGWYLNSREENGELKSGIEPDTTESWIFPDGRITNRTNGKVSQSSNATMWPGITFSAKPDALLTQLSVGHPIKSIGTPELFVAIEDLYRETNPEPAVRAAALELIARADDVVANGVMADRLGRAGRGYSLVTSYTGLPTRKTLIFDQDSGYLLDSESVLIESAGKLNVTIPAVSSYTMFTHHGREPQPPPQLG